MKKLLVLVAVVAVGLVVYNYATTGTVALLPPSLSMSADERAVADLEQRFEDARREVSQAGRGAGLTGMDMTGDADAAMRSVQLISNDLRELQSRLSSQPAKQKAETLAASIESYQRDLR